jgi:polar amino acid transport system permease protein
MTMNGDDTVKVVPVRHFGRWVGAGVALLFIAMLVHTLFSKVPDTTAKKVCHLVNAHRICAFPVRWRFQWNFVFQYFTTSEVLHGLLVTLELTVLSMTIGIILGVLIAVMRLSHNRLLSSTAWTYTWFFRGTPVYVQLIFWSNIAILFPYITLGVPFFHVTFLSFHSVSLFSPFRAAIVAFGLNEAAYMSEIARSGLIAVDEGQSEAATSLGMTRGQTLRFVVLPQAMRVILPPTGNEVISMLKTTSLASYIGVAELLGVTGFISAANFETMALLIVASLWYLIVTTVLSIGQFYLERKFAKGALRTPPMTPIQRIRHDVRGILAKFPTGHRALGGSR